MLLILVILSNNVGATSDRVLSLVGVLVATATVQALVIAVLVLHKIPIKPMVRKLFPAF